ncbi:hypothetical protein [Agromyces binzhouensis]|uniref:hypothetical protein n=1 Tax=Agromyces binzhouensis TaxID=1817495 RepID=UPI003626C3DB
MSDPTVRQVLWAVGGAGTAALVVSGALIDPLVPVAAVGGLVVLSIAAFQPKVFALIAVIAIIVSTPLQSTLGTVGSYADELVVVIALASFATRRFLTDRRLVLLPGSAWFAAFIAVGLVSSVALRVPIGNTVEALFLITKGLLFALALAQLRWTVADIARMVRAGIVVIVVIGVIGTINFAVPIPWSYLVADRPPLNYVAGLPSLSGPFQHPAAFGRLCAVLAIAVVTYGLVVRRSVGNIVLIAVTAGLSVLSFQVKSLVGLLTTIGVIGLRFSRPIVLFMVLAFGPIVGALVLPTVVELIAGDVELYILQDSARSTLTTGSIVVANQYFPLGAGFSRYGSYTAGQQYSPEYVALGFPNVYGLGPGDDGMFLNDTQWPAIIGESGWLGAACFALGVVSMFIVLCRRISDTEASLERWVRVTGIGWLVLLLVESVAAPVFVSAPSYPFAFAAVGVVASLRDRSRFEPEPVRRGSPPLVSSPV